MKRSLICRLARMTGLAIGLVVLTLAASPASVNAAPVTRMLAQGAGVGTKPDPEVRRLQRILRAQGRSLGPAGIDGRFGPDTAAAVRSLQGSFGLSADGIVGPKTRKLLRVVCGPGDCVRASNRSAETGGAAPGPAGVPSNSEPGSGALGTAGPTLVALLGLIVLALAYGWSRSGREQRRSAAPSPSSKRRPAQRPSRRVIGYLGGGAEAEAQEKAIEDECRGRGWTLIDVFQEVPGGGREALAYALERILAGDANGLVAGSLASVGGPAELGHLLERLGEVHACFLALDVVIDTTTREGALAAGLVVGATRRERERVFASARNRPRATHRPGGAA